MEVADRIAVIRGGRLEQVGTPAECYDHPANDFVLTFLGPATRLGGSWVRPHDLAVSRRFVAGALEARVVHVTRLGFEVRLELRLDDGSETWAQLSRRDFDGLGIEEGDLVFVSTSGVAPCGVDPGPRRD